MLFITQITYNGPAYLFIKKYYIIKIIEILFS